MFLTSYFTIFFSSLFVPLLACDDNNNNNNNNNNIRSVVGCRCSPRDQDCYGEECGIGLHCYYEVDESVALQAEDASSG